MDFSVQEVEPDQARDSVARFFWEHRVWPFATLEEYQRTLDWRHHRLSDGPARVWLARDSTSGSVIGHIAVYRRKFRLGGRRLNAAVPGNFVVHPEYRNTLVGPRLAMQPRSIVRNGDVDLALAFGNRPAHQMFLRLGFRELGHFVNFVDVYRWSAVLRRHFAPSAVLGPALDLATTVRRRALAGFSRPAGSPLEVREVDAAGVAQLAWSEERTRQDGIIPSATPEYIVNRFLKCPHASRRLFAVFDPQTETAEGYVILSADAPVTVWDCQVNQSRIDIASAIRLAAAEFPKLESVTVPVLAGSRLARELRRSGYVERKPDAYKRNRAWSGYWLEEHPLAQAFSEKETWSLLMGSTHY